MRPFNEDGRAFIRSSAEQLRNTNTKVTIAQGKKSRKGRPDLGPPQKPSTSQSQTYTSPKTFSHYILNLPASALTFLPAFIGLYADQQDLFTPHTPIRVPMIHIYCFASKFDEMDAVAEAVSKEISKQLAYEVKPGDVENGGLAIMDVRDIAPTKSMYCASFRLPEDVAFRI